MPPDAHPGPTADNLPGARNVVLIVVAASLPVIRPFLFRDDTVTALRVSTGVTRAMLASIGQTHGRVSGFRGRC